MALRLVFCGTPDFALPSLKRLIADPAFDVVAAITQPDRARGRGEVISASPVKQLALARGLQVFQPEKITSEAAFEFFEQLHPDAVVIIAYGQFIPQRMIDLPRLGWVNLHASLLPKYRGAAPINWAIINGERETGLTTMHVSAAMDTGPILMQLKINIGDGELASQLAQRMAEAGAPLVADTLAALEGRQITPQPQDNTQATRAPLLKKQDGLIDWNLTAQQIYNRIRGLDPWPGAFTYFRGQLCHLWGMPVDAPSVAANGGPSAIVKHGDNLLVACGENTWMRLSELKLEGRRRVTSREFENGAHLPEGESFSSSPIL
ncbi:MAG TPA: methionyl-tRNA formyltransferase [Candidatus Acidoferrales bacterium]|nr:methionyl-tRNA formyltransferase [Candidatus Acidoferrales bacterium]